VSGWLYMVVVHFEVEFAFGIKTGKKQDGAKER
jgi:hypothetical protein